MRTPRLDAGYTLEHASGVVYVWTLTRDHFTVGQEFTDPLGRFRVVDGPLAVPVPRRSLYSARWRVEPVTS